MSNGQDPWAMEEPNAPEDKGEHHELKTRIAELEADKNELMKMHRELEAKDKRLERMAEDLVRMRGSIQALNMITEDAVGWLQDKIKGGA